MHAITPSQSLTIAQVFSFAWFVGMCFFAEALIGLYDTYSFTGNGQIAVHTCLNGVGCAFLLHLAFLTAVKESHNSAAKSVACLSTSALWFVLFVSDGLNLAYGSIPTDLIPPRSIYANLAIFATISLANLSAWRNSGSHLPDLSDLLVVQGYFSKAFNANSLNLLGFSLSMAIAPVTFYNAYTGGAYDGLPTTSPVQPFVSLMIGNWGLLMFMVIASVHATLSAAADSNTKYRLLRGLVFAQVFWLGTFSKETPINLLMGWGEPMKIVTFVPSFSIIIYQALTLNKVALKVPKATKID